MHPDNTHKNLPNWIKQLRSQSWQIEILIAGSTVYTLFSLSDHLRSFFYHTYPGIDFTLTKSLILFGVYIVTRILLIGFIGNLILRAVWLAYLGINFAFPNGIDFDKLKNNNESKEILKSQPSILQRVTLLEKLSKLSYSLAILLGIFMTSVFITTLTIHLILELIGFNDIIYEAWFSYTIAILIAIIQLGVLDRLFLSRKSNRTYINKIKKSLSVFLEYFTLSFLFRREFLAIKSNTNRWLFAISAIIILALSSVITAYQIGKYYPYGTFKMKILDDREFFDIEYDPTMSIYDYDTNITDETSVLRASIQSQIIKGRYLKLFVTSWARFDKKLKHGLEKFNYPLDYDSRIKNDYFKTKEQADSTYNLVINDLFLVKIDNELQKDLRWKSSIHPISKTKGYVTFIDIESLDKDEHKLNLYVQYIALKNKVYRGNWKEIYFWKE